MTYNNFEMSLVVFMPNITANHAITYTNCASFCKKWSNYASTFYIKFGKNISIPMQHTSKRKTRLPCFHHSSNFKSE